MCFPGLLRLESEKTFPRFLCSLGSENDVGSANQIHLLTDTNLSEEKGYSAEASFLFFQCESSRCSVAQEPASSCSDSSLTYQLPDVTEAVAPLADKLSILF